MFLCFEKLQNVRLTVTIKVALSSKTNSFRCMRVGVSWALSGLQVVSGHRGSHPEPYSCESNTLTQKCLIGGPQAGTTSSESLVRVNIPTGKGEAGKAALSLYCPPPQIMSTTLPTIFLHNCRHDQFLEGLSGQQRRAIQQNRETSIASKCPKWEQY